MLSAEREMRRRATTNWCFEGSSWREYMAPKYHLLLYIIPVEIVINTNKPVEEPRHSSFRLNRNSHE